MGKSNTTRKNFIPNHLLKEERERQGWSQKDLADLLNLPDARTVGRWERGETFPQPHYRRELARVFGKSMEELGLLEHSSRPAELEKRSPASKQESSPVWNVPHSFTSCVGRTQEIAEICALLERPEVRLLTILGPGGIGKTRLAQEIAGQMRTYFASGVCFVSLTATTEPALVLPAIAQELDIQEYGNETLSARLRSFFREKRFLLILDGFERLGEAIPLLEKLLAECASLKLLVTSQVPLHLQAEYQFPLGPLSLPARNLLAEPERLLHYASLALFTQRAQTFLPAFRLTPTNAPIIAEICIHLDGWPLAIELAASCGKIFPPQALLGQIMQQRFKVLTNEHWSPASRNSTLYGTIKWSYDLLSPAEQWVFRHMAVFAGGCTLEAIERLCRLSAREEINVVTVLKSLVDRSLIQQNSREEAYPSFTMLETLREFGIDCLRGSGEWEASQQAHAEYYLALLEKAEPHLKGAAQGDWLKRLEFEKENLRVALTWLLDEKKTEQALRFCEAFGKFYGLRGYWSEEQHWLEATLEQAMMAPPTRMLGRVLRRAGHLAYRFRDLARAHTLLEKSVALSQEFGDQSNLAGSLSGLGWVRYRQKKVADAQLLFQRSVEVARNSGDLWAMANTLESLGRFLHTQGRLDEAQKLVTESVALAREVADKENLARLLCTLVAVEISRGEIEQAEAFAWESYALARDAGNTPLIALALDGLAHVVFCREEYESAAELYERRMELAQQLDDRSALASSKLKISNIALKQGDLELGSALAEESLAFSRAQADDPNVAVALCILGDIKRVQRNFSQALRAYQQALQLEQEIGEKENIGRALIGVAHVLLEQGHAEHAAQLLGFARISLGSTDRIPHFSLATEYQLTLERARVLLREKPFETLWENGTKMKYGDVLALCDQYSNTL